MGAGKRRCCAAIVTSVLVLSACTADDGEPSSEPGGEPPPSSAPEPPGVEAERIEAGVLVDSGYDTVEDLVSTDDLPPTAVGSATAGDGSGTQPVVWELGSDQTWGRTDLDAPEGGEAFLQDVTAGPEGPLAVGVTRRGGTSRAAVWSKGAEGWGEPVPIRDGDEPSTVEDVAGSGELVIAHGTVDPPGAEETSARNRVWVGDGSSWAEVELPGATEKGTTLADVAAGPGGLAVVGSRSDGSVTTALAWTSTDGETWEPAAIEAPDGSYTRSVVAFDDGFVVGGAITPGATPVPALWWVDGSGRWVGPSFDLVTRSTDLAASRGNDIVALTSRNGTLAATNGDAAQPEVWLSTDGAGWDAWPTQISTTTGYDSFPSISDLALDGAGRPIVSVREGPNLLVPEGDAWVEAAGAEEVLPVDQVRLGIDDVVVHDGRLVLAGWSGRPDRPGRPAARALAFWSRVDDEWQRVEPQGLRGTSVQAAASTDLGIVAVGYSLLQLDDADRTDDAMAAISPDGRVWDDIAGLDRTAVRILYDVAAWRGGWVAAGVRLDVPVGATDGIARPVRVMMRGNATTGTSRALAVDLGAIATPDGATESLDGVCTGAAGLVVVGSSTGPSGRRTPLVARADDVGSGWTTATADDDFATGRLGAGVSDCVVDGRQELLLHGTVTADDGDPEPVTWRSGDGGSWARLRSEAWGGPGQQEVAEVAPLDAGWLAVGTDRPEGEGADVALWLVDDADQVTRIPLGGELVGDGDQTASSIAVRGDDVFVVGTVNQAAAVWRFSLEELRAAAAG